MVKSRNIGDGHPTFNRNPYNGYINPYYWVDDHPLLYGNNGSWSTLARLKGHEIPMGNPKKTPKGHPPGASHHESDESQT